MYFNSCVKLFMVILLQSKLCCSDTIYYMMIGRVKQQIFLNLHVWKWEKKQ